MIIEEIKDYPPYMECFDYSRNCEDCILEWLQQQAEEDKHEP